MGSARSTAAATDAMVQKVNQVRVSHRLRALRPSASLDGSSQRFAEHLMAADILQHRARPSTSYSTAGEVLALHGGGGDRIGTTVAEWMNSPSHRAVLLSRSMREIGAGVTHGRFGGSPGTVWVVQVGKR
jgi:uncharacterized protein YkwD